jgi:predicted CoA-binding protein
MTTVTTKLPSKPGSAKVDRVHDLFGEENRPLDPIFCPKNVALVGASERAGSVGRTVLWNLLSTPFGGTVYPVNPGRRSVLGIRAYSSVAAVPEKPDLVVVVTPAATVPGVIREAVELGVRAGIIISSGFKEHGEEGKELERQIAERNGSARQCGISKPKWRALHCGARLELARNGWLQRARLRWIDARCRVGRSHRLFRA